VPRAVLIEPCYEICTCYWYYAVENHLWRYAPLWAWRVDRLRKRDATRIRVVEAIESVDPQLVAGCGHGAPNLFTGQFGVPIFSVCTEDVLARRIVFLLSCDTAAELGPDAVRKGARAYIGWDAPVVFVVSSPPRIRDPATDPFAWPLFDASLSLLGSLMWGKTAGEAVEAYMRRSSYWYRYWLSRSDGTYVAASIAHDAKHLRLLGDPSARIVIGRVVPPTVYASAGLAAVASALALSGHRTAASIAGLASLLVSLPR